MLNQRAQVSTGEHLEPVDGYFSSHEYEHNYYNAVRAVLLRTAVKSPAMMVTLPSFQPERAVYITNQNDEISIVSEVARKHIWCNKDSSSTESTESKRNQKAINTELANILGEVFRIAIAKTCYAEDGNNGYDGINYYFVSFVHRVGARAGKIWSPSPDTMCGKMVELGKKMEAYSLNLASERELCQSAESALNILTQSG